MFQKAKREYFKTLGSPCKPTPPFLQTFNGLLFRWTLWIYRPNLKSAALPVPEIIAGSLPVLKTLGSSWIRRSRSSKVSLFLSLYWVVYPMKLFPQQLLVFNPSSINLLNTWRDLEGQLQYTPLKRPRSCRSLPFPGRRCGRWRPPADIPPRCLSSSLSVAWLWWRSDYPTPF